MEDNPVDESAEADAEKDPRGSGPHYSLKGGFAGTGRACRREACVASIGPAFSGAKSVQLCGAFAPHGSS